MSNEQQYTQGIAYVIYAENEEGEMVRIAGQTDGTLSLSGNLVSVTNKDDFGWDSNFPTNKSWSISTSSLLALSEEGHELLEDAFMNNKKLPVEVRTPSNTKWQGMVYIESLSYDLGVEDIAKYSANLVGQGKLERVAQTEEEEAPVLPEED